MSCKVRLPGDPHEGVPLVWRQAPRGGTATGAAPGPAEPDPGLIERQWDQRVREAHAAGFREGEAAGRSRAAGELDAAIQRMARAAEEIAGLRPRLRREAEQDVVKLAIAVARRVLRREMAVDGDALRGLVMAALEKLAGQEICRVRVHPGQAALVKECLRISSAGQPVEVLADQSSEPGAALFETRRGDLDASVETQLQEIERGLTDRLRRIS